MTRVDRSTISFATSSLGMQLLCMYVARKVHYADQFRKIVSDQQLSFDDIKIGVKSRLRLNSISEGFEQLYIYIYRPSNLILYIYIYIYIYKNDIQLRSREQSIVSLSTLERGRLYNS